MIGAPTHSLLNLDDYPVFAVPSTINTLKIKFVTIVEYKSNVIVTVFLVPFTVREIRQQFGGKIIRRAIINSDVSKRNFSMIGGTFGILRIGCRSSGKENRKDHHIPEHQNCLHSLWPLSVYQSFTGQTSWLTLRACPKITTIDFFIYFNCHFILTVPFSIDTDNIEVASGIEDSSYVIVSMPIIA